MIMKKEKLIKKIQQLLDDLGTKELQVTELDTDSQIIVGVLSNGDVFESIETIRYDDASISKGVRYQVVTFVSK